MGVAYWLGLQLHKNHLKGCIAQILDRVLGPRGPTDLPSLRVALLCLPVREGELLFGSPTVKDDARGMLVHWGVVMWVIVDTAYLNWQRGAKFVLRPKPGAG